MKKKNKRFVVAAYVDPCGTFETSSEEEYERIKLVIKRILKSIKFIPNILPFNLKNKPIDIYVFDYGGMGMIGHEDTTVSIIREFIKAVENYPNSLFIIWSSMTFNWYQDIIAEEGADALCYPNVIQVGHDDKFYQAIKDWFNV